jgi:spoIIIJ-associated protein
MAPIVEFEGKSVEKAVKEASQKLNIPARKLKHDVISHGSTGIFGLVGAKRAKIRVSIPENEIPAVPKEPAPSSAPEINEAASLVEEAFDLPNDDQEGAAVEKIGRDALQKMVDHITTDATIDSHQKGEKLFYNVSGGNTAVLIGKRGQTLEAMQYLVEKIVNKQSEKRVRIEVDVEGYLEKKREKLKSLAIKLGEKVKQTRKPATVGQLNAYDRRIVHLTLKPDSELRTQSIGEGYYRKLKIFPKQRRRKGKSSKAADK